MTKLINTITVASAVIALAVALAIGLVELTTAPASADSLRSPIINGPGGCGNSGGCGQ